MVWNLAMGRYLAVLAVQAVMLASFTGDVSAVTDQEFETMQNQVRALSAVLISQAAKIIELEEQLKAALGTELVQNRTIEERVALLELQMTEVQVDADKIEMDVDIYKGQTLGLEQKVYSFKGVVDDHEARITSTEGDAADLQKVNRSVSELEERVETLEGTAPDQEARTTSMETDVEELQRVDINHDARITALEENRGENETIAFHTVLNPYHKIRTKRVVKFNEIVLNEGNGYNNTTGVFTVPPGGDGLYYFSTYLVVDYGEGATFDIQLNDNVICTARGDQNHNGADDTSQATCSAVVSVVEGDEVKLVYRGGSDSTPLYRHTAYYYNGFNGFRI